MHEVSLPIILTSTGYGGNGSSAGTNILEEFSSVSSFGNAFECTFLHEADGVGDLEHALGEGYRLKIDLAVKRFLSLARTLHQDSNYQKYFNGTFYECSKKYIESITAAAWKGSWHRAFETQKISFIEKQRIKYAAALFTLFSKKKRSMCYEPDGWHPSYIPVTDCYCIERKADFYEKTKVYTAALFSNMLYKTRYIVVDQLLPACDIGRYVHYFNSIKTLVIDRDPRDLYALQNAEWGVGYIPHSSVDLFIRWYKATRAQRYKINTEWKDIALFIPFECLIYEYEVSLDAIKHFTGLTTHEHIHKRECFIPEKSVTNTQVYKRYPQLRKNIEKIEKELEAYCFPFEQYPPIQTATVNMQYVFMSTLCRQVQVVQLEGRLAKKCPLNSMLLIIYSCTLPSLIKDFPMRKSVKSKLKGIIKSEVFFVFFPVEFFVNLILFLFTIRKKDTSRYE